MQEAGGLCRRSAVRRPRSDSAVRQPSLDVLQLLLDVVEALLQVGNGLRRRGCPPGPLPVAVEVPLEVVGPVLPGPPVHLADPHLSRLALGDRDDDALRRAVAEELDGDRLAALLVAEQPDELAARLDAVAVDLRDDVSDLESG